MFSRGRNKTKLHLNSKQILTAGELLLAGGERNVRLCRAPSSLSHIVWWSFSLLSRSVRRLKSRLCAFSQVLCILTTQAAPLFSVWGDQHAVLIHTPALATPLASRRPALHQHNIQIDRFLAYGNTDHVALVSVVFCNSACLQTHLLLPEETSLVAVGHVDGMLRVK